MMLSKDFEVNPLQLDVNHSLSPEQPQSPSKWLFGPVTQLFCSLRCVMGLTAQASRACCVTWVLFTFGKSRHEHMMTASISASFSP